MENSSQWGFPILTLLTCLLLKSRESTTLIITLIHSLISLLDDATEAIVL